MRMSRGAIGSAVGLVWILAVLVTAGCSSSNPDSQNGSLGEKALQNLTPLGRTILADKIVTIGEYERAMQDTVGCLRTAGFTVSDLVHAADGTLQYQGSYSPPEMASRGPDAPPPDTSEIDAKQAACEHRSTAAAAVFMLQHAPSKEEAKKAFGVLITCAETLGVKISVSKDSKEIDKVVDEIDAAARQGRITGDQAIRCEDSFKASTSIPLPGLTEALANYKE